MGVRFTISQQLEYESIDKEATELKRYAEKSVESSMQEQSHGVIKYPKQSIEFCTGRAFLTNCKVPQLEAQC